MNVPRGSTKPVPCARWRMTMTMRKRPFVPQSGSPPKRKFETFPESFTEGSKNVRHLPRYLSIQRDPEFFSAYHH